MGDKPTTLYASVPRGGQRFGYLVHTVNGDNVLDHRVDLDEQAAWVTK